LLRREPSTPAAAITIESAGATWAWLATAPDADLAGDWLVAYLAATAGPQRKQLFIVGGGSLSLAAARQAGLEPLALADVPISTRLGRAPGAVAAQLRRRLDRGL